MEKLENLSYSNFCELIDYLGGKKEEKNEILNELEHFFPTLTATEEVDFVFLVNVIANGEEKAEEVFNNFKKKYPNIEIDPEGKTEPTKKRYWEIGLRSLDMAYDNAIKMLADAGADTSPNKINSQICNAKNLICLIRMGKQEDPYVANRVLFLKKNKIPEITASTFNAAEKQLKQLGFNYDVLNRLINYCKFSAPEKYYLFIKTFFQRLYYLSKDEDISNESNKEFYNNLKDIEAF